MEFLEVVKSRRSIRKFKSDEIPENYITELIEAGRFAPSGINIQPTRYVVIKSEDARKKLNECTPLPFVGAAPVVIACCVDNRAMDHVLESMKNNSDPGSDNKKSRFSDPASVKAYLNLNAAIAIDHITLRAVDLGLGTCWVMMFDQEKVKNLLGLDENHDVVALLPVGYPDQSPSQRPRLDMEELLLKEI
jgi:nitroreductase